VKKLKYKIEQGNEEINSIGGICLVGAILDRGKHFKSINNMQMPLTKKGLIPHGDILKSMIGLNCLGKTDYADIELYRNDILFMESLKLKNVPSEECLRQRLDECGKVIKDEIRRINMNLLKHIKVFGELKTPYTNYTPIPMDVTVMNNSGSNKEVVGRTYKGNDGFAPMNAYIGTHGYLLNCELRPGVQHSQKGMEEFLLQTIEMTDSLGIDNALHVLDSAHDAAVNIDIFQEACKKFIIKRNLRKESLEQWLGTARRVGECKCPRPGKNIFTGVISHMRPAKCKSDKPLFVVFEVIERITDASGEAFLIPEIEVNTWWTNIPDDAQYIIDFYHQQGTSEQFHSELKSDMNIERLPSGKFSTNSLLLQLAMIAYNCLRKLGQKALTFKDKLPVKLNVTRRRLRNVIQDLMYIACKRVSHANSITLKFGRHCPWFDIFRLLYVT
jgi:Transposase DDE domain group 1